MRRHWLGWWTAALQPAPAGWAVVPACWAAVAGLAVAAAGILGAHPDAASLAYFGVACAAVFVTASAYGTRLIFCGCQGIGAAAGIAVGVAVAGSTPVTIAVAAGVAFFSGALGAIGPVATATALMAVIGLSFGEFARLPLVWWQQSLCYLAGTLVVLVIATAAWPIRRDRPEWFAVATVFDCSARLLADVGTDDAASARTALAAASATSRSEVLDHRLGIRPSRRRQRLLDASAQAEQVALRAADMFIRGRKAPAASVHALHDAARQTRVAQVPVVPSDLLARAPERRPPRRAADRMTMAVRTATNRTSVLAGLRLSLCMTVATATTSALHSESHSFWLPLTVAVAVRPEYGTVFVRAVNRVVGTVFGGAIAAVVLLAAGSGWPVAIAASLCLGFAVFAAPKLYALSVVGVTCSALLSTSITRPDPTSPGIRTLDTLLGAAIALVFGYLLWPGRRQLPARETLREAAEAAAAYLRQATLLPNERRAFTAAVDLAYKRAHQSRQALQAALREPSPVRDQAAALLPAALALEDLVDDITGIANDVDAGRPAPPAAALTDLAHRIEMVGHGAVAMADRKTSGHRG
jgi:uncharacterized membrane protein YccC